jgi:hypothetical protein
MGSERLLLNFFYAYPVGHAVEALHYCHGYHAADPEREISVVLNAETPVRLADFCPFVASAYAIAHPFVEASADSASRLAGVPPQWDWTLDDVRRRTDLDLRMFPGCGTTTWRSTSTSWPSADGRSPARSRRGTCAISS